MRFDEYLAVASVTASPVSGFDGWVVDVGLPADWETIDVDPRLRVWVCTTDPRLCDFAANAVLTLHRVEAALDPAGVFAMLCDQQRQSTADTHQVHREFSAAADGPGSAGLLAMQIESDLGIIDSVSRCRILGDGDGTLVAQLTVTALHDSPVERAHVKLRVSPAED